MYAQTSIGTGYDLENSIFSPDGRNFQVSLLSPLPLNLTVGVFDFDTSLQKVEYASKAVENGGTAIGIRCKDGVVLALEKIITSKLLKADANKRIATVDRNFGIVCLSLHPYTLGPPLSLTPNPQLRRAESSLHKALHFLSH